MKHIWRIFRFTASLKRFYIVISFLAILGSLSALLHPLISGWAIDEISLGTEASISYVIGLAVAIFLLDVAGTFIYNVNGYIGDQLSARLTKLLSERYYQHLLKLPQQFFDVELSGKIINRLNRSVVQIASFMHMWSNNFLQFVFTTVFSLVAVAYYSLPVAILLFSLYPIYIWLTVRTSDKWQKYQKQKNDHFDIASGRFAEAIGQIKVVKSFIQEKAELAFLGSHFKKAVAIEKPQSKYWHVNDVRRRLVLNFIFLGVYLFIFLEAVWGRITPGEAVAVILLAQQIRIPIFTISFLVDNTQRAIADSKDYFEIMDVKPSVTDMPDAKNLKITRGAISFEYVDFSYGEKKVLNDITFELKPDSKVALVGESGEGKTTITNLLMRLYEPQKGKILIDGQDISTVTQKSLRSSIGVVFQEPALFSGTIKENIAYGKPNASHKQIEAAAKAANAHEFINKFENKYDTEIGERGLKLSGGQKQRIAIARALLKDAPILILDEATSSLDSKSEAMVQEALQRLMKGRTTLIIAHRLSTISHVDQIITLQNGRVSEIGSPQELAVSGGIYDQLLKMQHGSSEASKKNLKKYEIKE